MIRKTLVSLVAIASLAHAEVLDTWKIQLGGMFVNNFETDMQLGKKGFPVGAKINTKDQLGLDNDTAVFRLDGYYRFNNVHSMEFSYFSVRSEGRRYVDKEFEWNGDTLSDVLVNSYFNMDIYKLNYAYSFYHNSDIELALLAGFHITGIDLGLSAEGVVNGEEKQKRSSGANVTVPLPVFGFKGEYTIIPQTLFANVKSEYFFLKYDVYKGAFIGNAINVEYRFLDHYGLGLGFSNYTLTAEMEDSDKKVNVENRLSGVTAYLSYTY